MKTFYVEATVYNGSEWSSWNTSFLANGKDKQDIYERFGGEDSEMNDWNIKMVAEISEHEANEMLEKGKVKADYRGA